MAVITRNQVLFVACLLGFVYSFLAADLRDRSVSTTTSLLYCVQCTPEERRCESGNLETEPCPENSTYCSEYLIFIDNSQGLYRGCSSQELQGCRPTTMGDRNATICFKSCSWDGCNRPVDRRYSFL